MKTYNGRIRSGRFVSVDGSSVPDSDIAVLIVESTQSLADNNPKKWNGNLSALDNPIHVENFRVFTREELHEH